MPVEAQEQKLPDRAPQEEQQGLRPVCAQLIAAVVVAFVVRIGLMAIFHTWAFGDVRDHYAFGYETGSVAASLARGFGYSSPFGGGTQTGPTAWVAPLYPVMAAGVFKLCGIYSSISAIVLLTINSLWSALTCVSIYAIGKRVFGKQAGLWGTWIWAAVPFFARWPITWVWETSLAALLLSILFWMTLGQDSLSWRSWLGFGAMWGVSAVAAPSVLGFLPFSLLYPAWKLRNHWKTVVVRLAGAGLLLVVLIAPWLIRNYVAFHQPVFLRSNFWFEFYLGNFHGGEGQAWSGAHPASNPAYLNHYAQVGEIAFVAEKKATAFEFVKQNKVEFAEITLKRVKAFWDGSELAYEPPDPFSPWMLLATSLFAGGGLWLAVRRRVKGVWVFVGLFALYPIPYYLTYTNPRYRHPIEPMMAVLTAFLLAECWQELRFRRF